MSSRWLNKRLHNRMMGYQVKYPDLSYYMKTKKKDGYVLRMCARQSSIHPTVIDENIEEISTIKILAQPSHSSSNALPLKR